MRAVRQKWSPKARKMLLGWTCFVAAKCVWDLLGDYIIQGRQQITSAHVTASVFWSGVIWLLGVLAARLVVLLANRDARKIGGGEDI